MKSFNKIFKKLDFTQRLFLFALVVVYISIGAIGNSLFERAKREELIKQNKELIKTIKEIESRIKDYKQVVYEIENDPCLTEGAAAAAIDSIVTGSDSYTETGYQDPSIIVMDTVLAITAKINK
jgi:NhaP-type Na+/H+ and K+/H+ antiporter